MTLNHAALRAAAEAATRGPWENCKQANGWLKRIVSQGVGEICREAMERDAAFIAAANPAVVRALLDEIAELKAASRDDADALTIAYMSGLDKGKKAGIVHTGAPGKAFENLLNAARKARLALAHLATNNPIYQHDYEAISDAIDAAQEDKS